MLRVNNWSLGEFAELFYMVMFELFDPEKSKVVLEYNTFGATLLSEITKIFDGEHDYSSGIFLRYKHRKDDVQQKIGIKITGGEQQAAKKILVKSLQGAVKKQLIKLHNDVNINEISVFTKKETAAGNFTYQCESGHDDTVMSLVTLSSIFTHVQYKNLIESILETLDTNTKKYIEDFAYNKKSDDQVNYTATKKTFNKVYKNQGKGAGMKKKPQQSFKPYKSSPWD